MCSARELLQLFSAGDQITEVALDVRSLHGLMAGIRSHKLRISFVTLGTSHRITEWIGSDS